MDKLYPKLKITLDKERTLYLGFEGMIKYQELTGKNPLEAKSFNLTNLKELQAMLISCLIHEDNELKAETITPFINAANIRVIQILLVDALNASYPKAEEGENKEIPLVGKPLHGEKFGLLGGLTSIFRRRNSGT